MHKITANTVKIFFIYALLLNIPNVYSLNVQENIEKNSLDLELLSASIKQKRTSKKIVDKLKKRHYKNFIFDDELSSNLFDKYLSNIDPAKRYFSKTQIQKFEKYRFLLDDHVKKGNLQSVFEIFNEYRNVSINYLNDLLINLEEKLNKLDFTIEEKIIINSEKLNWQIDQYALSERNRRILKNTVLSLRLEDQTDSQILETLSRRFKNQLNRIKKLNNDDVFQLFMNSLTELYDPHTNYFSPKNSENFNINMRLSLEGIGALLKQDGEHVQVERLITAGPADKQGELKPTDKIVSISQNNRDFVDVIGWRLDEVVELIRGKKGTPVTLGVVSETESNPGKVKKIKIIRNTVKLEEQSAKKDILNIQFQNSTHKIGVISIPTFYMDFEAYNSGSKDYKSTTRDVKKLMDELNNENIKAIIVDLRGNGGGSLPEVIQLIGLFVERGPAVQIRTSNGRIIPQNNYPNKNYYDKPITVLIDKLSASASEIFAGAIQDYGRGLIIGSKSFGKGTVQQFSELDHGSLKITEAMFYRISGESTQHRGVTPDIILPSLYDNQEIGEDSFDNALPWDSVKSLRHKVYTNFTPILPLLNLRHEKRISINPEYKYLIDRIKINEDYKNIISLTLNEKDRKEFLEDDKREREDIKSKYDFEKGTNQSENNNELPKTSDQENIADKSDEKEIDFHLNEAALITLDAIHLKNSTRTLDS